MLALGAELVAISPQLPEKNAEVVEKNRLEFPVLSDAANAHARRLSLVFELSAELRALYERFGISLPEYNGDDSWELPIPARIVTDTTGAIRGIEADPDYTKRPEPEVTVDILRSLT